MLRTHRKLDRCGNVFGEPTAQECYSGIILSPRQFSYDLHLFPELAALSQPLKEEITQKLDRQFNRYGNVPGNQQSRNAALEMGAEECYSGIILSPRQFSYDLHLFPELAALSQPLKEEITQKFDRQFIRYGNVLREPTIQKCGT
ncbi:hypothetical protein AVEN_197229-1 [Araneus ventricosus]|uniref:Uncharacterized protein n=1 Tax=Araneus ventricosus TaxID=182803 RepID=A0A4Y2W5T1_ARAVE|nr:hypothetical protein AVEN_197229-1 [Araneus ventricosus]